MSWETESGDGHSSVASDHPLLYHDVNYPRQPNHSFTSSSNSIHIPVTSQGGYREVDLSSWDDEAIARLRSTVRPAGDLCDCVSVFRRLLGLRDPCVHNLSFNTGSTRKSFGVVWFVRDPCGIFCLIITWFLILYAEFVVFTIILVRSPSTSFTWLAGSVYHLFAFLAVVSHFKAFSTDPGTIPIGNATRSAVSYITEVYGDTYPTIIRCPKCMCIKPPRSHHCRVCFRCVRKMDHHCPWVNNCVGEGNQKYFVLFTLYICLQSFFAVYMCVHFVIQCVISDWDMCQLDPVSDGFVSWIALDVGPFGLCAFILGLVMEALVFGLFTLIMCISQVHSIVYDETGIESLSRKSSKVEVRSKCKNLAIICGSPISWRWINPFYPPPVVTPVFPGLDGVGRDIIPSDLQTLHPKSVSVRINQEDQQIFDSSHSTPANSFSVQLEDQRSMDSVHARNGMVLSL